MANTAPFLGIFLIVATCTTITTAKSITAASTLTARGISWQEVVPNYPEDIAETLLNQLESQNKIYILTNEQSSKMIKKIREADKEDAMNKNYTNLCSSTKRAIFPLGVNINNEQYYVLNPPSRERQMIITEYCNSGAEGGRCQHVEDAESGYETECTQEYVTQTIYLMSKENPKNLIVKSIPIASCCSCTIKYY